MVDVLLEGLISAGLDSVDRRLHARRVARLADKLGLRYDAAAEAPHMARTFGEIATGRLTNILSGQIGGGHAMAWERGIGVMLGDDHMTHLHRHPAGHFVAVPLQRPVPGVVAQRWHPMLTPDECPWLPGGTRMRLSHPVVDRQYRVTAVDHEFARRLVDERALAAKPRRSWAILGTWAVCFSARTISRYGKTGLRAELAFARDLAARCSRI